MNRRAFFRLSSIGVGTAILAPTTMLMTGCGFSVTSSLNTVILALQSILQYVESADPTASWIASVNGALTGLQQAESTWQAGGADVILIDALNTVETVIAAIPLTVVYSPLIDLIVSGIEEIITYLGPITSSTQLAKPRSTKSNNPRIGRVLLNKPDKTHPTYEGAFKSQYNDIAIGLGLKQLKLS